MQNGRKATISDIAAASGLSKTTVSRYINGMTHLMSEETCIKLKGIIERMNYRPSSIARSLKSKKTHTVGVVVADISSPWSSAVVGGIGDVLLKEEYIPIFANANEDINREKDYITSLLEREVDGLIVNTASDINPFLIEIAKTGVPIVLCDRYVQDYDFDIVTIDNEGMMFKILEHLKEQGFTRIALA